MLGKDIINIKPYLKNYIIKKDDNTEDKETYFNFNPVDNIIICTFDVLKNLPIEKIVKGKNKDKLHLDFNKIISIKEEDFYSNMKYDPRELEVVKKKRY